MTRRAVTGLTFLVVLAVSALSVPRLAGQAPARPAPRVVAIKGATLVTVTKGTIPNGTIVLRDGKIAALGANVAVPDGADVVDAAGKFVSPGIIDAHSHIAADSINEGGTTVSSMTGIEDVLDPTDRSIFLDLAGGLTTANVLHGSANPIGGKNSVIKLRWGKKRAEELLFQGAMPGIKFALGENPKRSGGGAGGVQGTAPRRYPGTRLGVEFVIRDAFTRAKGYQRDWQEFERRKKAGEDVLQPRRDLQLEPLVEILDGKRLVHAHSYRADEILMLIRLAEEMGFKISTFQHVLEGYKVAKEIAAHGAGASTFSDWWGYKIEAIDAIPYNAAIMVRKGVLVSINSDSAEHARRLNTEAAKSMRWGNLSEDEALALVTINPAKQLRIDARVGSLEVGKDADVVIWTHHPLSSYAIVDRTYIDGVPYYERMAEERRLTELQKEKESLSTAERSERRGPTTDPQAPRPQMSTGGGPGGDGPDSPGSPGSPGSNVPNGGPSNGNGSAPATAAPPPQAGRTGAAGASRQSVAMPAKTAVDAAAQHGVLAITNAKIHPVTKPVIERGTIVMRNGKIEALGADVKAPAGAKVIDAGGADVYPGFINANASLGLSDPGAGGFGDDSEILDYNPHLRTAVAFHFDNEAIPVARANGITTIGIGASGGIFGGQMAVMNLDGWSWEEATVKPNVGVTFRFPAVGGGGGRGGGGGGRGFGPPGEERTYDDMRKERDARLDELMRLFDRARAYAKAAGPNRSTDWVLEALVPIVEKKQPLFTSAGTAQAIKDAIAFSEKAGVSIVLVGAIEAPLVAPLLKEKNVPVILGQVLSPPSRPDGWHAASYQAAGELARAGVKFAFSTGDTNNVRTLPFAAGMSIAWGLSHDEAIRALTIDAAEILGAADVIGSLEPGKMGNLFITKGDPLEIRNAVTHVIINGKDAGVDNKHLALYQKWMGRP